MYIEDLSLWWLAPMIMMCIGYTLIIFSGFLYEPKDRDFKVNSRLTLVCLDGYINTYYLILGTLFGATWLYYINTNDIQYIVIVQYCMILLSIVWVGKVLTKFSKFTYNFLKGNTQ